jgi:hypothetical protein
MYSAAFSIESMRGPTNGITVEDTIGFLNLCWIGMGKNPGECRLDPSVAVIPRAGLAEANIH